MAHRKIRQCHWQRSFTGCASAKANATVFAVTGWTPAQSGGRFCV
ncbi:hypothetical protein [Devosia sp. DBB001]|nr:hypothetical protein [Devosia sp. DBB001]